MPGRTVSLAVGNRVTGGLRRGNSRLPTVHRPTARRLYPRLPAWLRSETAGVAWRDLRLVGLLWAVSVVIGVVIVS